MLDRAIEYKPFLGEKNISLTVRQVMSFLCRPTKSGKKCTPDQAVRFLKLCEARGLNPWEGDAFIVGYDAKDGPEFNLVTAHQAFLKRAEVHPEYDGMDSGVIVRDKDGVTHDVEGDFVDDGLILVGGWATVYNRKRSHPIKRRLKLSVYNKGFSRWSIDPAGMIVKCAEADALRSAFPNSLGGMYLDEEMTEGEPDKSSQPPAAPVLTPGRHVVRKPVRPQPPAAPAPVVASEPEPEQTQDDAPHHDEPPSDEITVEDAKRSYLQLLDQCVTAAIVDGQKYTAGLLSLHKVRTLDSLSTVQLMDAADDLQQMLAAETSG